MSGLHGDNRHSGFENRQALRRARRARSRTRGFDPLLEALEDRRLMSATQMATETISWNGRAVEVKDDSYIFRVDATNKATATTVSQYRFNAPAVQAGWSAKSLGYGFYTLNAPGTSFAQVQQWAARSGVASVEPNFVMSTSPSGLEQPAITKTQSATPLKMAASDPSLPSQWALQTIQATAAWNKTRGSSNVIVAVMNSGIQADHPDLAANMWSRPANVPASLSGVNGYDFANDDDVPEDVVGTGTAMAGVIGAVGNNDIGISGVSPIVKLYAAKVTSGTSQTAIDTTIAAMLRIVQLKTEYYQPFEVVVAANSNLRESSAVEQEAIRTLGSVGILYVVNAGDANGDPNSGAAGLDLDTANSYPSNYSEVLDNVLTVAATTQADEKRLESRHGNERIVQIAAPGDSILTTVPTSDFQSRNGTAMAAAHVAGAAAILKAYRSNARMQDVKQALLDGADKISALNDYVQSGRRLNVNAALDKLTVTPPTPGGLFPTVTISNVSVVEGNSGFSSVAMTFQLSKPAAQGRPVTVAYATADGSAFAGRDYVAQSGTVSFTGYELEKTVVFRVIGNTRPDADRTFNVVLNSATSKNVVVPTTPQLAATVTILDDDLKTPTPPTQGSSLLPRLTVAPSYPAGATKFAEGSNANFNISLSRVSDKAVVVKYRTADIRTQANKVATPNLDYVPVSGSLVFKPGELTKTVSVRILADTVDDDDETLDIILSEPVNAALGLAVPAVLGATAPPSPPPGTSGFTITVTFPDSTLSPSQQAAFAAAAARWSEIITGDLPDVVDKGITIDDVMIEASAPAIDGAGGILGQAGPTAFRTGPKGLPYKGVMEFDSADVSRMQSNGSLNAVILHEMAHVLGVGTVWQSFGLLVGAGSANPVFTGTNAVREYNSIFGTTATGVPVENTGGSGTRDGHWRESVFKTELMTGWAEKPGTPMPISRITVGQFQDLGYTVDYSKADAYTKPAATAPTNPVTADAFRLIRPAAAASAQAQPTANRPAAGITTSSSSNQPSRAVAPPAVAPASSGENRPVGQASAFSSARVVAPKAGSLSAAKPAANSANLSVFAALGIGRIS